MDICLSHNSFSGYGPASNSKKYLTVDVDLRHNQRGILPSSCPNMAVSQSALAGNFLWAAS